MSDRIPLDCPQCVLHYEAHFPSLDFAFSSVGLSRGMSKADTARSYFRSFHGRGHRGALWGLAQPETE